MPKLFGQGSSRELTNSPSSAGKDQESPRTITQRGTSTRADMSLKAETQQEKDLIVKTTLAEAMVSVEEADTEMATKTVAAPITQELAIVGTGPRPNRLATKMRNQSSASESGSATLKQRNTTATMQMVRLVLTGHLAETTHDSLAYTI